MDTALFNIFDFPMALAIFVSFIIASVLIISGMKITRHLFLAVYFYTIALIELDKLIFWSMPIHRIFEPAIPAMFTLGKFIGLLAPLLLYFYIRASNNSGKLFYRKDIYWLVIPIAGIIFSVLLYETIGANPNQYSPSNYHAIFFNDNFIILLLSKYGLFIACLYFCRRETLDAIRFKGKVVTPANETGKELPLAQKELRSVIVGALWIYGLEIMTEFLAALETNRQLLNGLGVTHNYMVLFYVCYVLVYMLNRDILKSSQKSKIKNLGKQRLLNQEVKKIHQLMMEEKYYLDSDITLEQLAKKLKMQEYYLSNLLNKNFHKNFFDFINHYRMEHAKELMITSMGEGFSILDILYDSGFNSKSAFNRCFKKNTGITPSEYREKCRAIS